VRIEHLQEGRPARGHDRHLDDARAKGATVAEIAEALEWQHHTVRGAIAGALKKKLGLAVASDKVEGRGRVYRLPQ